MKKYKFFLIAFLLPFFAKAQYYEPKYNENDPNLPEWVKMMYAPNPNLYQLEEAFKTYFTTHPFEKNLYTKYYKRWRHWATQYANKDGVIHVPTAAEQSAREKSIRKQRKESAAKSGILGNWVCIGPKSTYSTGVDQQKVTWQTNIYSIDQSISNPDILLAGGETGGVFKSIDHGLNWSRTSDNVLTGSIRPVKISPTNPNNMFFGADGKIMKSIDGGATWTLSYSEANLWTNDMAINPSNPQYVYAATNKGFLRSINGGTSWTKVYTTECWTVAIHPSNANIVYTVRDSAATSVFCKSTDMGMNFSGRYSGWWQPTGSQAVYGVRISVSAAAPDKVFALMGGSNSNPNTLYNYVGVFVSSNAGDSWANTNPSNAIGEPYSVPTHANLSASNGTTGLSQGFYDFAFVVNPTNANELIAAGTSWWKSTDGGATWNGLGGYTGNLSWSHPDMQQLCAVGNDLWLANDGGINYSTDFATTITARMDGVTGSDFWGFDTGWNEDVMVGGRYHNGNTAYHENYPEGKFLRMGGAESATGYVSPGENKRTFFSDIGGKILPTAFTGDVKSFPVSLWPNESYYEAEFSEMEFDPRCWNNVYIGYQNKLYKSTDGGASYSLLHFFSFGTDTTAQIEHIEIARTNPMVMYVTQRSNSIWDGKIWKTSDGGVNWTELATLPTSSGGDRRVMSITLSATNENELWVALHNGDANEKVFKTINGGTSWINWSSAVINSSTLNDIVHQIGTNGGVYVATNQGAVYYRNNTMPDWVVYSAGLPLSVNTLKLKPFYKKHKIRLGSYGHGIWENDLYETTAPIAQISVNQLISNCPRDTFYFEDHSSLFQTNASWTWSFPGSQYVSSTTARNPKVVYPGPGTYSVSLTVTDPNGTSAQTLTNVITVNNGCAADTIPGKAVSLGGNNNPGYVYVPSLNMNTNTLTITAWVKPDSIQPDYSSIFMLEDLGAGFNFREGNNTLGYHWPDGAWWWDSNLTVPAGQWSFVAMVVTPTGISLYVNGVKATHAFTVPAVDFSATTARIGNYHGWGDRYVKGKIDEVAVYKRSLSQAELRLLMHLTQVPANDSTLVMYYQFNEANGAVLDRAHLYHGALANSAARVNSTIPAAGGVSASQTINTAGTYTFGNTGASLSFGGGTRPAGEVIFSRLNWKPDTLPACSAYASANHYWIADNYGTNQTFSAALNLTLGGITVPALANLPDTSYTLFRRTTNAEGPVWGSGMGHPSSVAQGTAGSFAFNSSNAVTQLGQFVVTNPMTNQIITGSSTGCINAVSVYNVASAPGVTYTWSIPTSNGIIQSGQGTASVAVKWTSGTTGTLRLNIDAGGACTGTAQKIIALQSAQTLSAYSYNTGCGGASGEINLSVAGGVSPFTYLWSGNQTTQDLTGLTQGTYTVSVTSNIGCIVTGSYVVDSSGTPSPPHNLVATNSCSPISATLTWKGPSTGTYEFRYRPNTTTTWTNLGNIGNVNTYTVSNLLPNTLYFYAVRFKCASGKRSTYVQVGKKSLVCLQSSNGNNSALPNMLTVFPNPASDKLQLDIHLEKEEPFTVRLLDAAQQEYYHYNAQAAERDGKLTIPVSDLPSGLYLVLIEQGRVLLTEKVSIVR